jgi:type II secretory pathway predicted ATPase ExeA
MNAVTSKDNHLINKLSDMEDIHNIFVEHGDVKSATSKIVEIIETHETCRLRGISAPADNLCLTGESGSGKTTICHYILSQYPRKEKVQEDRQFTKIPTFYVTLRSKSIKGLASVMLTELNDPNPHKGTKDELTDRLEELLKNTETNLIIMDEFHNLIDDKNSRDVLDWLKSLINRLKIPVLIVGTPEVKSLIDASNEMSRRFKKMTLKNLEFDPSIKNSHFERYVTSLLKSINKLLPFLKYPPVTKLMLARLHIATNGYPANISQLLKEIGRTAIRQEKEIVLLDDLKEAFVQSNLVNLKIDRTNPFEISDKEVKTLFFQLKSR